MTLDDIPLFSMLKAKLGYDAGRQRLIAENVANSETPGFAPRDLKAFSFDTALRASAGLARTEGAHLVGKTKAPAGLRPITAADSEARLDGNQVVLEEQMMKMSDARADYDAAIGFYQQSMTLLRTAARKPGG
jgi:flagellar basal-body rod protein FlgB